MSKSDYIVVTPVRDEREHFARTIASMVSQTVRPQCWVIVDDGSKDGTGAIADRAAQSHSWIRVVHRPDRGARKQGGGVIEAFYDGLKLVGREPWDFLIKLDGDLSFEPNYFASCLACFHTDPGLGIGGGLICQQVNGTVVEDSKGDPKFHVRGATKIYRRACWDMIGGLIQAPGWDTFDEIKANMLDWRTYSFKELPILQLKPTGSADGAWRNWVKNGRANYIVGYHPLFMLLKCVRRFFRKPLMLASFALGAGFLGGYLRRVPRVNEPQVIRYLRRQQMNRLLWRKSIWV